MTSKDLGEPKQVETIKMPFLGFCFIFTVKYEHFPNRSD